MQGGVFASSASANTYDSGPTSKDDFQAGPLNNSKAPKLTVTKYKGLTEGSADTTGSYQDEPKADSGYSPESGVVFSLTEITKNDQTTDHPGIKIGTNSDGTNKYRAYAPADFENDNGNKAWKKTNIIYYGITGNDGKINSWSTSGTEASGKWTIGEASSLPTGHNYYVLEQLNNPNSDYSMSQQTVFDLPYRATNTLSDGTKQDGYVYHLHVFPKNVSTTHVHKTVKSINGDSTNKQVAQIGDKVTYELSYKFDGVDRPKDGQGNYIYTGAEAHKLYVSDITHPQPDNNNPTLRLVDRYSDKLLTNPEVGKDASGKYKYSFTVYRNGAPQNVDFSSASWTFVDYNAHANTASTGASPNELNSDGTNSNVNMFTGATSASQGINYLIWDFNKNTFQLDPNTQEPVGILSTDSDPIFTVDVTFTLTSDDEESNLPGSLVNDLNSSTRLTPKGTPTTTHTPSAGFQFGKTDSKGNGLDGAVFRLVKGNSTGEITDWNGEQYLASDGKYYTDSNIPSTARFVEAISNNKGIVTFQNLPIFNQVTGNNGHTSFIDPADAVYDVVEYQAPSGYKRATMVFGTVSFAGKIKKIGVAHTNADGLTTYEIPADLPENTYITPDDSPKLDFGSDYTPSVINIPSIKNRDGEPVTITTALKDFNNHENPPIHLPLTGGMGIVLLLVIGAVIMAIVIIERKRREANARR